MFNISIKTNKMNKTNNEKIREEEEINSDLTMIQEEGQIKKITFVSALSFFLEIVKTVIICLAIILPVRYFLIQPFMVDGASMQPNFHDKDYLIINEISYRFQEPKRGEVIVFKNPDNVKQYYIKRVIAIPGETIKFQDGEVYIKQIGKNNFLKINENEYLPEDLKTDALETEIKLNSDEYFVMGDNRRNSRDSRVFGPLQRNLIIGRVLLRGFPFNNISLFNFDNYNFFQYE